MDNITFLCLLHVPHDGQYNIELLILVGGEQIELPFLSGLEACSKVNKNKNFLSDH